MIQFFKLKPSSRYETLETKKFPKISRYILLFSLLSMLILILISLFLKGVPIVL
ncbi:MAG: hypothetical protein ACTSWE_01155 [Promethearchaeota archaeon]